MKTQKKSIRKHDFSHLSKEQFKVLRERSTEPPYTGDWLYTKEKGVYRCAACLNKLFSSEHKFHSGTGWPSFFRVLGKDSVIMVDDHSLPIKRIEVVCKNCNSHLGHVFDQGPYPNTKQYCINSVALDFISI